jgi:hypothetical protein
MPADDWDATLFVERLKDGAFDGHVSETLGSLSTDQIDEVNKALAEDGWIVPEDLKRSG